MLVEESQPASVATVFPWQKQPTMKFDDESSEDEEEVVQDKKEAKEGEKMDVTQ